MNTTALLIQLVSGIVGGNVGGLLVGSLRKESNLGVAANSIVGLIAGGLGGQFLSKMMATYGMATGGDLSAKVVLLGIFGGGIAGIVAVALAGIIKSRMSKA